MNSDAMNCDLIARWYRLGEYLTLGRALERQRREYLKEAAQARRVLLLGDGDGRFTAELGAANPGAEVDSVDLSKNMLRLAAQRLAALPFPCPSVRLHQADALTFPLSGHYDLTVTHFFLDCLSDQQVRALAVKVAQSSTPQAAWIVSEFATPNWAATLFVKALYIAFRLLTGSKVYRLPDHSSALMASGFKRIAHKTALGGLLVSELWRLA